jgi:hypothetical protein
MDDRELLRLAAKAAGIEAVKDPSGVMRDCTGSNPLMNIFSAPEWNPLTDDGDALRLAVKLKLLSPELDPRIATAPLDSEYPYAATRRAIVRAAAEIGKAMK